VKTISHAHLVGLIMAIACFK